MSTVALVPRRADGGRRDELWRWIRTRWELYHPDVPIYEGDHDDGGPFNRSAAVNAAASAAGDWTVAIVMDSDSFAASASVAAGVDLAARTGRMVLPYDRFVYLGRAMSERVMRGYAGDWWAGSEWSMTGTCSSLVIVRRDVWDAARGFDPGFVGWGMEDVAASLAFQTFGGGLERIPGEVWHLWHAPAPRDGESPNGARMLRYAEAAYNRRRMRRLLDTIAGELAAEVPDDE